MNGGTARSEEEYSGKRTNPIPGPAWIPLVAGAVLLGFFNDALGGWGLPAAVGAAVILIPVLQYRRYWHGRWFWLSMVALSIVQIPLIFLGRPLMDEFRFAFNLVFGVADLCWVVVVINWVRPKVNT
jgi:hypothetical protein